MSSRGPTQTTTSGPPEWFQDYGRTLLDAGGAAAQQPYQPYGGPRVADLSPLQQQALGGYGSVLQGAVPGFGAAAGNLYGTLTGAYQNPFQQQVADRATRGVTDAYNRAVSQTSARFNDAGNWGSARHGIADQLNSQALATGLGDALGGIYSGNYEAERNRQMQATQGVGSLFNSALGGLGQALTAGNIPREQQQQLLNSLYGDFTEQRDYPWSQLGRVSDLFRAVQGGAGTTQTSRQGYDPVSQGLGLLALGKGGGR